MSVVRSSLGKVQGAKTLGVEMASEPTIEVYEVEDRTFPPSDEFKAAALTSDLSLFDEANADFEAFWARQARELVTWQKPFTKVLEWDLPFAKWFSDGQLNVSENCLDRHVEAGLGDRIAYHFEGEPGDTRTLTYGELLTEVKKFANVLKDLGRDVRCSKIVGIDGHVGLRVEVVAAAEDLAQFFERARVTLSPTNSGPYRWVTTVSSPPSRAQRPLPWGS